MPFWILASIVSSINLENQKYYAVRSGGIQALESIVSYYQGNEDVH